jgi:hypothetical protein
MPRPYAPASTPLQYLPHNCRLHARLAYFQQIACGEADKRMRASPIRFYA